MRILRKLIVFPCAVLAFGACASTPEQSLDWGRSLAEANCARCHAVGPEGGSPNAFAPLFRDLRKTYSLESIERTFGRGQIDVHPPMPSFAIRPEDLRDLLNYIKSV